MNDTTPAAPTLDEQIKHAERLRLACMDVMGNVLPSQADVFRLRTAILVSLKSLRSRPNEGMPHKPGPVHVDEGGNIFRSTRDVLFAPLSPALPAAVAPAETLSQRLFDRGIRPRSKARFNEPDDEPAPIEQART